MVNSKEEARQRQRGSIDAVETTRAHNCPKGEMLNYLTFYLDGGMYTFLYPLDACHPDPPAILPGNVYPNRANS
jgi:hypothetical protein